MFETFGEAAKAKGSLSPVVTALIGENGSSPSISMFVSRLLMSILAQGMQPRERQAATDVVKTHNGQD